jgi:hypothetical protein
LGLGSPNRLSHVYLDPNMMSGILLYGFAGALLGGIDNPWGAFSGYPLSQFSQVLIYAIAMLGLRTAG